MTIHCSTAIFMSMRRKGRPETQLNPDTNLNQIPDSWRCPVCGMPKEYLKRYVTIFLTSKTIHQRNSHQAKNINYYGQWQETC